jgi:hypothetical protein
MIRFDCPSCGQESAPDVSPLCAHCGTEVRTCGEILFASFDSLQLCLLALAEGRDKDAHEFAHESWGLRHTIEAAGAGLIAATLLKDPIEISRWLRRRGRLLRGDAGK